MMRKFVMPLVMAGILVTGCKVPNPCGTLAAPTPDELRVVAAGAGVEREVGSWECDLVNGVWTIEPKGKGK